MGKDVIIALDFDSREKTLAFLDRFTEEKPFVKVGMELFYAEGPAIVREIRRRGHRIFLDLKLHDIPNTVKKAMAALSALDVDIVNLHAAGTLRRTVHRGSPSESWPRSAGGWLRPPAESRLLRPALPQRRWRRS